MVPFIPLFFGVSQVLRHVTAIAIDNGILDPERGYSAPASGRIGQCVVREEADILFLIDGSSSVGIDDFRQIQAFIINVISAFNISSSGVRVGIVQYSTEPHTEFSLNEFDTKKELLNGIGRMKYKEGKTFTGKALKYLLDNELTTARGHRDNAYLVTVVITDGASQDSVRQQSIALRNRGSDLFAVAITPDVNDQQLFDITGEKPQWVFKVDRFKDLQDEIKDKLVQEVCSAIVERNESPPGTPEISCKMDYITISAETRRPFNGRVYVKGHYDKADCRTTRLNGDTSRFIKFQVPTDRCGVRKGREINPRGLFFETTVIISFHPKFVTKIDKAYNIRCFFMEADKLVTQYIDVSMITTQSITISLPMPTCAYTIHRRSPNGPLARFVNVGDKLFHVWRCITEHSDIYSMLVHKCSVDDGTGDKTAILDGEGCMIDPVILQNLIYDSESLVAYQEVHAFKFADKNIAYFSCQIAICLQSESECQKRTPPRCITRRRHKQPDLNVNRVLPGPIRLNFTDRHRRPRIRLTDTGFDLYAKVSVLDLEEPTLEIENQPGEDNPTTTVKQVVKPTSTKNKLDSGQICMLPSGIALIVGTTTLLCFSLGAYLTDRLLKSRVKVSDFFNFG